MFVALWEFEVKPGDEERFERAYGPEGLWAKLFRRGSGYHGTRLLRQLGRERSYVTIDLWETREAFESFRREHAEDYKRLDKECEGLTTGERKVGDFVRDVASALQEKRRESPEGGKSSQRSF